MMSESLAIAKLSYKLKKNERKRLLRLFADIMEMAYRRGVQQTIELSNRKSIDPKILENTYKYRYGRNLKTSVGLDGFLSTSIERLLMEHPSFMCLQDTEENK